VKRFLACFLTTAALSFAMIGGAYRMDQVAAQPPPPAPPAKTDAEKLTDYAAAIKKQADELVARQAEIAALRLQLAKAQQAPPPAVAPAPMPVGPAVPPAVKAPAPPNGRGYIPLTPAQRAKFQAADLAKHGDRIANHVLTQVFPPAFNAATVVPLNVGDQAQCGSCYECSTAKTATASLRKAGYGNVTLSWQYGMDSPRSFGGCNGGNGTEVIDWMCKNGWIAETWVDSAGTTHNDYPPYEAQSGRDRTKSGAKVWMKGQATWGFVNRNGTPSVDEIKAAIFNYGRLNIALDAGGQFGNGTSTITSLGNNIDHEINCSGWDDTKDGGSFLLENQWSDQWGNAGYRWITYKAAQNIVDWFWVSATPLPPVDVKVSVPNVVGGTFAAAKAACAAAGLSCDLAAGNDAARPVTGESPAVGTMVATGSTVTVTTAVVPVTVAVPNVVGKTLASASNAIAAAGLIFSGPGGADPSLLVTSEVPAAGTMVSPGSTVTVTAAVVPPTPGTVTLELTAEQVQKVIAQAGGVVARKEMTLGDLLDALNKSNGGITIKADMTLRELLDAVDKAKHPKPLAP
jgi:beta-lactam-binding protein with PASTA domain